MPARHEEEVLGETLDKLARLNHPDYEVIAIIGHDDPGTEAVARAAADRHPDVVRVVMDYSVPKNKEPLEDDRHPWKPGRRPRSPTAAGESHLIIQNMF